MDQTPVTGAPARGRLTAARLALLSLPLYLAVVTAVASANGGAVQESVLLVTILNALFGVVISLIVAHLAGLSYLSTGSRSHLYLCAGSWTFAGAYLAAGPLMALELGHAVTVHNIGVLIAGGLHLVCARRALRARATADPPERAASLLAAALGLPLAVLGLAILGSVSEVLPDFYVPGEGMRPLRQVVLGTAVAGYLLSSLLFAALDRRGPAPFLRWYALGLAMVGLGLATVIPGPPGSTLSWVGRLGQYLGCCYLLVAALSVRREASRRLPLERALRRTEEELDAVFNAIPFLLSVVGSEGRHERVNPAMVRLFGFDPATTPREEVARRLDARFPDGTPLTPENMPSSRALRGERVDGVEYQLTDAGGRRRTLVVSAIPLSEGGRVYAALLVQRDVTEERAAAARIRHLASFPELTPSPVVEVDFTGAVTFRNAAAVAALRELGLEDDARALLPADFAGFLAAARLGAGEPELVREVEVRGRIFGERLHALPALGVVRIFARDLTDLKRVEAERSRLYRELEGARAALESKVQERTADLDETVRQLTREIESRKEAERALRLGEGRLRAAAAYARSLIDASLDAMAAIRTDGTITDVNPAMEEVTGVPRDRLVGRDFAGLVSEPDRARAAWREAVARGSSRDALLTIPRADGSRSTEVLVNASVYRDAEEVAGVFVAARDVTEHNASIRRLRVTSELLKLFQELVTRQEYLDAVVGVIRNWSGCECVGIRVDDGAGRLVHAAGVGFDAGFLEAEGSLSLEEAGCVCTRAALGTAAETDRPCLTPAGSFRCDDTQRFEAGLDGRQRAAYRGHCFREGFASLAAVPIRYRGRTRGLIHLADRRPGAVPPATVEFLEYIVPLVGEAIHRYDTEAELERHRAHLEELVDLRTIELQRTAAELERSNRDLGQFASAVSHDLKEPLRAVAGYASLLRARYGGRLDDKADAFLTGAAEGTERMQRLIDDLLAYSRAGARGGEFRPTDAGAALTAAVANLRLALDEAGAVVTNDPLPTVLSDASQLAQLFQNLIGNAVKFRGAEGLRIHVGAARDTGQWRFWVRDNGIGIEPRFRERIFEIFQRLHPRSAYPGTGIGLAVCKRIVERHGGRVWVESEPGRGATFFFTVPDARGERR